MNLGINNRLALVTGSSRGIGKAIAQELADEGARVVLVARNEAALAEAKASLHKSEIHFSVVADLMTTEGIIKLADFIRSIGTLDILVHNLGGSAGVFPFFSSSDEWMKVWQFNVGLGHELNRLFLPSMIEQKWGRVVHITTNATRTFSAYPAYVAAKCSLDGYIKTMSREVSRHNVIVSGVSPGMVAVEGRYFYKLRKDNPEQLNAIFENHAPMRRLCEPSEVSSVVGFLCSEKASFMAGSIVDIGGGSSL